MGVFSQLCQREDIKQVYTNSSQKNKAYLAERAVRTIKKSLVRMLTHGERNFGLALKATVDAYNSSVHAVIGLSPNDAEKLENRATVLNAYEKKRKADWIDHENEYRKSNDSLKPGDKVRIRYPPPPFAKERELVFSDEIYSVERIVPTHPSRSYKIKESNSDFILPHNFLAEQLMPT